MSVDSLSFNADYILHSEEANYEFGKKNDKIYLKPVKDGFRIFNRNRIFNFESDERIQFKPKEDGSFVFKGQRYHGNLALIRPTDTSIYLINTIGLERYLKSVVPKEMPSNKAQYLNALKAQAICARTYALQKINDRRNHLFDVYGDQRDQVFGGDVSSSPYADKAVEQTHGDVLMQGDSLAVIFYHASDGGIAESAEALWPGIRAPYLQSKKDALGDSFACAGSPYFRWQKQYTFKELDSLFGTFSGRSYLNQTVADTVQLKFRADVRKRSASGRITELKIAYGDTSLNLSSYQIRRFFGDNGRMLPSTLFHIRSVSDTLLTLEGGGHGHGVGMCQWGAIRMSEKGFKYYDILVNHYFPGTFLKKVY